MQLGKPTVGLKEAEGRKVLREAFRAAGYEVVEDYLFDEGGVRITLDGWDARHRVGYEYITAEGGDRDEFRTENIGKLVRRMERGELHLLLVDGAGRPDGEMMEFLAHDFLAKLGGDEETLSDSPSRPSFDE
jgi:hypothetical protein